MESILISGCSTGIGRATAQRLAQSGYRVFAGVRREADGEAVRREVGRGVTPVRLDVTDLDSVETALETVASQLDAGILRALVNNAGVAVFGPLEFVSDRDLRIPFEVNVFGTMALTRAALPLLRHARGRLVNVSSGSGRVSAPLMGPYSASKFALEALSDALRSELRSAGVDVVLIEPGAMRTPMIEKEQAQIREVTEGLPERGRALYGEVMERFVETHAKLGTQTTDPEAVAAAIQRAIETRRPRTRYAVGRDMQMIRMLRRCLPDRTLDALFSRMVGL